MAGGPAFKSRFLSFPGVCVGNFFKVSEPQCPWPSRRVTIATLQIVRADCYNRLRGVNT